MDQKEMLFSGSVGSLHGLYHGSEDSKSIALVLPPHPKHGGTMKNKVVKTIFDAFVANGFATLRMNFRGVGHSEGELSFDESDLLKDANSAIVWLQSHYPLAESFWIGGFSFGSWLALNIAMRRPEISGFVAVSPALKLDDFSFFAPCMVPGLLLRGDRDHLCDVQDLLKITTPISSRVKDFKLQTVEGADHRMSSADNLQTISYYINRYLDLTLKKDEEDLILGQVQDNNIKEIVLEEEIA